MKKGIIICQLISGRYSLGGCGDVLGEHVGSPLRGDLGGPGDVLGEHMGSPLRDLVQWFKTMTTNEYIRGVKNNNWPRFDGRLWQRNYFEHIVRNERGYQTISDYIFNNPLKWPEDKFYQK